MERNISRRSLSKLLFPAAGVALSGGASTRALLGQSSSAAVSPNLHGAAVYNVRDYGAAGDGKTLDTAAVQRAIDQCHSDGGGTVLIPAGAFLIGTVELKSNITLHLAAAGKLMGSAEGRHYHAVDQIPLHGDTTLEDGNWALLFAVKATNISIEGEGAIDGQGAAFRSTRGTPSRGGLDGNNRPYHMLFYQCQALRIRDLSLLDSAYHSVRIIQSSRVHIDGVYIHNRVNGNNDGFHFISATHVTLSNCIVKCQDDACAMFGSCQYITITNSSFSTRWSVFRFGGGEVKNITVSNCLLYEVYGCPIKFQGNPGNHYENISFSNLQLDHVTGPISISIGANTEDFAKGGPAIAKNISFSNIRGTVIAMPPDKLAESVLDNGIRSSERNSCIVLNAIRGSIIENICFDDVHLSFAGGGTKQDAAVHDVPLISGEYFKLGTPPAYALYARNVRGLALQNVRFQVEETEWRPAISFVDVEDVSLNNVTLQANAQAECLMRCNGSRQMLLSAIRVLASASTFLQLEGPVNEGIIIDGGDLTRVATIVDYKKGAQAGSVKLRNLA